MFLRIGRFSGGEPHDHRLVWSGQIGESKVELWYPNDKPFAKRMEIKKTGDSRRFAFSVGAVYENPESVKTIDETILARWLGDFCQTGKTDFLKQIDGNFTLIFADPDHFRVLVAGDIRSLFPIYYASEGENIAFSWRMSNLLRYTGFRSTLSPGSMLSAVCNGLYVGSNTRYRNIRRFFPGEFFIYDNGKVIRGRHYRRDFSNPENIPSEALADMIERVVKTEIARAGENKVLALSGGIDSRALLAVLARTGIKMDSVTWGSDRLDLDYGDFQAGGKLAAHVGLPHRSFPLDPDRLSENLSKIVDQTEGMLLHIGSFPHGEELAQELAQRYGTIFFGAHCLGMGYRGFGRGQALLSAGIRTGLYSRAAASLLKASIRRQAMEEYQSQIDELLNSFNSVPTGDLSDMLDYHHTSPGMEAQAHWIWAKHLYPSCPLTTRAIMEFSNRFTRQQRDNKQFLADTVQKTLWPGQPWPTNTKHSRINWDRRVRSAGKMASSFARIISEPGPFYDYFDRRQVQAWLKFLMPSASLPESKKNPLSHLYNRFLWGRTRSVQLAHLAVLKVATG